MAAIGVHIPSILMLKDSKMHRTDISYDYVEIHCRASALRAAYIAALCRSLFHKIARRRGPLPATA
jgi:hypothetical protein